MINKENIADSMRLAVFDLDGTLLRPRSSWKYLHRKLGTWKSARLNSELFYDHKITWEEWANRDAELWKGTYVDEVLRIAERCPINPGAKETVRQLREQNIEVAIISGGLSFFADRVGQKLGIPHVFANSLGTKNGKLTGEVTNSVTQTNKCEILFKLLDKLNISAKETVAIGDDFTMIQMFKIVGLSIAFNSSHPSVSQSACVNVENRNMSYILPYILANG